MAVQAQFGAGLLAGGCVPYPYYSNSAVVVEEQVRAVGAILSATANEAGYPCAAQSDLSSNGGGGSGRKRGRDDLVEIEPYVSSSSAALLPIPGMQQQSSGRVMSTGMASTSGRSVADALVSELCRQGAEVDALVRAECERLRDGLEHAWKRQRQALVRAVAGAAERRLREKEAELYAARRRAGELEERVRQAAAESQACQGAARANEAVAAGLRATLDRVLLLRGAASSAYADADVVAEGFGESDPACCSPDAQSCCFEAKDAPPATKRSCKACREREASVLVLPCRHLCLCKACEPRLDACPVCLAVKNASIHVAPY